MLGLFGTKNIIEVKFDHLLGLLFLILFGFTCNLIFVFGIMFLLLNCLKNIYHILGMKTIY